MTGRSHGHPVRQLRNQMTREYVKKEKEGASFEELEYLTLGALKKAHSSLFSDMSSGFTAFCYYCSSSIAFQAEHHLAAAVSEAGGLGLIGGANAPADVVRAEIRKAREMTKKEIGVNVMLLSPYADEVAKVVVEEGHLQEYLWNTRLLTSSLILLNLKNLPLNLP